MTFPARAHARARRSSGHGFLLGVSALLAFLGASALGATSCFVDDTADLPDGTPCTSVDTCDAGDNPCMRATCKQGFCGTEPVPDGVGPLTNAPGDCRTRSCKSGEVVDEVDDKDRDDNDPCTADDCEAGVAEHEQLSEGAECFIGTSQGTCDAGGDCEVKCSPTNPCMAHEPCATWDCEQGICVRNPVVEGDPKSPLPPLPQIVGDCMRVECEMGEPRPVPDEADAPEAVEFECRSYACDGDEVVPTDAMENAVCGSGLTCVGGECRTCMNVAACDLVDDPCRFAVCDAGTCRQNAEPLGTPCELPDEEAGLCNADALCVECLMDDHCAATNSMCAKNLCINGSCERVWAPDLTSCGAGNFCNDGSCVECVIDEQCSGDCCNSAGACGACD